MLLQELAPFSRPTAFISGQPLATPPRLNCFRPVEDNWRRTAGSGLFSGPLSAFSFPAQHPRGTPQAAPPGAPRPAHRLDYRGAPQRPASEAPAHAVEAWRQPWRALAVPLFPYPFANATCLHMPTLNVSQACRDVSLCPFPKHALQSILIGIFWRFDVF